MRRPTRPRRISPRTSPHGSSPCECTKHAVIADSPALALGPDRFKELTPRGTVGAEAGRGAKEEVGLVELATIERLRGPLQGFVAEPLVGYGRLRRGSASGNRRLLDDPPQGLG
jgi:hypothetical protein